MQNLSKKVQQHRQALRVFSETSNKIQKMIGSHVYGYFEYASLLLLCDNPRCTYQQLLAKNN